MLPINDSRQCFLSMSSHQCELHMKIIRGGSKGEFQPGRRGRGIPITVPKHIIDKGTKSSHPLWWSCDVHVTCIPSTCNSAILLLLPSYFLLAHTGSINSEEGQHQKNSSFMSLLCCVKREEQTTGEPRTAFQNEGPPSPMVSLVGNPHLSSSVDSLHHTLYIPPSPVVSSVDSLHHTLYISPSPVVSSVDSLHHTLYIPPSPVVSSVDSLHHTLYISPSPVVSSVDSLHHTLYIPPSPVVSSVDSLHHTLYIPPSPVVSSVDSLHHTLYIPPSPVVSSEDSLPSNLILYYWVLVGIFNL